MLLYTETSFKMETIDPEMSARWDRGDGVVQPSAYLYEGDERFNAMQSKWDEQGGLDETGRWDARTNDPQELACRLCGMELGWRRAGPSVHPDETVPFVDRTSGLRQGYTRPPR